MTRTRLLLAAPLLAVLAACAPVDSEPGTPTTPATTTATGSYVVQSVDPSAAGAVDGLVKIVCVSTTDPAKTKTWEWDALAQPVPEVGDTWLCNEDAP